MDSSISSTSLNYDDLENKMKCSYKLPCDLEAKETYGIVNIAPGKFEGYIDPCLNENELWETSKYIKQNPNKDYTWTSFIIDEYLDVSKEDLSEDAEVSRIMFCKMYVQDFFPRQPHRFHDKETNKCLKQRGITLKQHYTKAETRKMKREAKEERRKGKDEKEGKEGSQRSKARNHESQMN